MAHSSLSSPNPLTMTISYPQRTATITKRWPGGQEQTIQFVVPEIVFTIVIATESLPTIGDASGTTGNTVSLYTANSEEEQACRNIQEDMCTTPAHFLHDTSDFLVNSTDPTVEFAFLSTLQLHDADLASESHWNVFECEVCTLLGTMCQDCEHAMDHSMTTLPDIQNQQLDARYMDPQHLPEGVAFSLFSLEDEDM